MRVFLLDVYDNGKQIYLNTRDEEGTAHVLRIENVKRTLFYVFSNTMSSKEGTTGIIGAYLQKIGVPMNEVTMYQRSMALIDPETREMTPPRIIVQVVFERSLFFTLSQASNLRRLPKAVEHVLGMDFTAIEYLLGYGNLRGWLEFNDQSPHVKKIATSSVFKKREQYSLTSILNVLSSVTPQPPTPSFLTFALYQNKSTSKFAICSNDGTVEEEDLTETGVNDLIVLHNPAVVCVHDFESLSINITIRDATADKKNTRRIDQLVVDTFSYAKELKPMKKDYSLDGLTLSSTLEDDEISDLVRARNTLKLANEMGVVELIFQISVRTGQPCSKVPSRLGRVEWMLLSKFIETRCVPPDKMASAVAMKKSKESYTAGLVLEPKCGVYEDPTLLLDFRSLYPSLFIEYLVCYSTTGVIIPRVLKDLVETRKFLKTKAETCKKTFIMCTALKLLANATYGCLACPWSRFYSVNIAKKTTQYGREQLIQTTNLVRSQFKMEVIYGDTDSLFVATPHGSTQEDSDNLALNIINTVNSRYNYLELEYEASFDCFILFGKKHYAGFKRDRHGHVNQEIKGLDLIKRGFSPIGSRISRQLVDFMLSEEGRNEEVMVINMIQSLLKETVDDIRMGQSCLSDFVITAELSRNLSEYKDTAGLYHVQAAIKQQKTLDQRPFQKGDFIKFIMTESTNPIPYERHWGTTRIGELPFQIDVGWYMRQMVSMIDRLLVIYPSYNLSMIQEVISSLPARVVQKRNIPSSSSSSSSSQQPVISVLHPTAYMKRRVEVILTCSHCETEAKYIGVSNLEISALNISREEPEKHTHITPDMIQKLLPANLKQCQSCNKDYDFVYFLDALLDEERDALLLNINIKRMIRQFNCCACQEKIFLFFKKENLLSFFYQFVQ